MVKRKPPADEIDAERRVHAKAFGKELRKQHTAAEEYLWYHIRRRQIAGFKFRDQQAVEGRVIDFYCAEARLGIEVDGDVHDERKEEDEQRQKFLENQGLRIVRFSNDEVLRHIERVLEIRRNWKPGQRFDIERFSGKHCARRCSCAARNAAGYSSPLTGEVGRG